MRRCKRSVKISVKISVIFSKPTKSAARYSSKMSKNAASKKRANKNGEGNGGPNLKRQSLGDMADELLFDDSDSETEEKLSFFSGNCCKKASEQACTCFLCRQCMTVDRDRLRWQLRKKDDKIKKLEEEIKNLKSK